MSLEKTFFAGVPVVVPIGNRNYDRHSNLTAVLDHARKETGRDGTGKVIHPHETGSWLGNVAYLAMADMLATIFFGQPAGTRGNQAKYTGFLVSRGFAPDDAQVIYELRCSLAHEFGLVNGANRMFTVLSHPSYPMITHPTNPGPLVWGSIQPDQITVVNLRLLGQALDDLVVKMKSEADSGTLSSVLPPAEFQDRFFFHVG